MVGAEPAQNIFSAARNNSSLKTVCNRCLTALSTLLRSIAGAPLLVGVSRVKSQLWVGANRLEMTTIPNVPACVLSATDAGLIPVQQPDEPVECCLGALGLPFVVMLFAPLFPLIEFPPFLPRCLGLLPRKVGQS
jgi:hypothetical protein